MRALMAVAAGLVLIAVAAGADTPGEEAVKQAVKALKDKRGQVKDKTDQALLDAAIKDLEDRLAQVGKVVPGEEKKDAAFLPPKGWELKFNAARNGATYSPKTGELKLVYDFADAKQLKDFEYADDAKPSVQKGVLTLKGGDAIKHRAKFLTLTVACDMQVGEGEAMQTTEGYALFVGPNQQRQTVIDLRAGGQAKTFVAGGPAGVNPVNGVSAVTLKEWSIGETKIGVVAGTLDRSGKKPDNRPAGQLVLAASNAPNAYKRLVVTGKLDPEWAKEFFADPK